MEVIRGAGSIQIVSDSRPSNELVAAFLAAATKLQADGACGLISSCGFLVRLQTEISSYVGIPVILSALSLGNLAQCATGGRRCGIVTANSDALDSTALASAGLSATPVVDMRHSEEFCRAILAPKELQKRTIDGAQMEKDVLQAARMLIRNAPDIGSIVLECGNLPPYKKAIRETTGLPVFSIFDAADLIWHVHGGVD